MTATALKTKPVPVREPARHKPSTEVLRFQKLAEPAKRLKDDHRDLFSFAKGSVGSDILIIRGFFAQQGLPEIPEEVSISVFATLAARFLLPRRKWPLFTEASEDRTAAKEFCGQWAKALLSSAVQGASRPVKTHNQCIPELLAYYNPAWIGAEVL